MEHPLSQELLPENVRQASNPLLPRNKKMAVAAGIVPMAPEDNVLALYQLAFDGDQDVAAKSSDTLQSMPLNIVAAAMKRFPWPEPLEYLGKLFSSSVEIVTALIGNRAAENTTVSEIAKRCPRDIVDIIAANQVRLMQCPSIIESIYLNRNARMSTVDRVISFALRNNVELEGLACFKEIEASHKVEEVKKEESTSPESERKADSTFETAFFSGFEQGPEGEGMSGGEDFMPMGMGDGGVFSEFDGEGHSSDGVFGEFDKAGGGAAGGDGLFGEFDQGLQQKKKKTDEDEDEDESKLPLELQLSRMVIAHKIRIATIGNSLHRAILLQDTNKIVAMAAIKSPSITDQEVVRCSQSRAVSEDILRYISTNRDWTKSYFVKVNLINNPKTPIASAMRFLTHLRKGDLKIVSSNKNVPNALRTAAKNMMKKKSPGGR